ncbi:hypothetical protein BD410DRAFT_793711 [Rickenella mellea]|uniref:Uncharacterized protein n=1 Tax=Rickenella mellea TaxID=50990 RepID=A0A4Y7PTX8_9AGAM|nr:hypothetical protein BD410DRAFT_793711 [Rickenella mellea]
MLHVLLRTARPRLTTGKLALPIFPRAQNASTVGPIQLLYDSKPRWWARWVWGLLALDIIFTTSSCDIVMNHWTQRVIKTPDKKQSSLSDRDAIPTPIEYEWELRPFWQRLSLCVAQLFVGAGVGAAIMAFRDRTVWRLRLLPALARAGMTPVSPQKSLPRGRSFGQAADARLLEVETGSGRKKLFRFRDCTLEPGRDETEMFMRIQGIRGHFWLGMKGARVLDDREMGAADVKRKLIHAWGPSAKSGGQWTSGPSVVSSRS